ncbi:UDP-glucose 4-epimerase [Butyrivibrio sp. INlla18]|uniref:NAD-dependent epimerase/dehydratase family protein n=1 Tax=Butyrivibrio sp. INlla18 TaxID=1520806 RepID=UPI00088AEE51|nr:NAD-dependent epimerase/dehydratase family protein [Butyrivibrio sp. INlla18]SDA79128.1 UDP-glucose 4-epimerase [Butyrivibrio sp. INlla18]
MKVLVTGSNGFIGRFVCESLEERDIDYVKGTRDNFDLLDVECMRETLTLNQVTHVIHLAAFADSSDTEKVFDSNISGLYRMLLAIKETGVKKLIFASGNNVYGEGYAHNIKETDIAEPALANIYGLSKYVGELLIEDMLKNTTITYSIMRISDVYGPGQRFGNLIKALVKSIAEKEPIKLYGEGKRTRDYIYVKDVADGLIFACQNDIDGVFNLSTGIGTSVKGLVDIGVDLSGGECAVTPIVVEGEDDSKIVLDPGKLNRCGYKAQIDLKEGLRRCAAIR